MYRDAISPGILGPRLIVPLAVLAALAGCERAPTEPGPSPSRVVLEAAGVKSLGSKLCYKNGWIRLMRMDGSPFANEGDCVSHLAIGEKLGQTIGFTSPNPSPVEIDDPSYTPHATATSGLPVTLSLNAASSGCAFVSGVVSFYAAGICLIDANQAGDAVWAPAAQAQQAITVNRKSQTITFTTANPSPVHAGDSDYTPTATATSGLTVSFTLDATSSGCVLLGGTVSFTAAGRCLINADQAGNSVWAAATRVLQSITIVVNPAQYCASIGGSFGGQTATALWTCNGWTAQSLEDASAKVDPLVDACRVDNGIALGPLDYSYTLPFPTTVNARCHLPD